jgi:hypothetical protein
VVMELGHACYLARGAQGVKSSLKKRT